MCDIISAVLGTVGGLGIVSGVVGGVMNAVGQQQQMNAQIAQNRYMAKVADANASLAEKKAAALEVTGDQQVSGLVKKYRQIAGTAKAEGGASGALLNTGSSLDWDSDTAAALNADSTNLKFDTASRVHEAGMEAWNARVQAKNYRWTANTIAGQKSGMALGSVFSIAGNALSQSASLGIGLMSLHKS